MELNLLARLSWPGNPPVKKNRQQILPKGTGPNRRFFIAPSIEYTAARDAAIFAIRRQYRGPALGSKDQPLRLQCMFYLPARSKPDFDNLYTSALDILQSAGVIANDYFVLSPLPESDRIRDAESPRTEAWIFEQTDYEWMA